ncbi:thioester reductase domain-containing protein [Amycolatopsis sp. 195334CR]|uniref:non-ribosomal peptide synthetase n=1 Tax=Amycolatopsis sp. 195334CR TaxID=2814588 RepID=UPI001A8D0536|nr:thioester reductase domain-containing protein [Amycolatopsis sp. 195334CR]MBN6039891.1 thioester reductase domain-containing protein [Amycolatopsis sp. 195334CR]
MTTTSLRSAPRRLPASPAQPGLWFASAYGADPTAYNQPLVLRPRVPLDHTTLADALSVVHQAHSALRTTFEADGELRQVVHEHLEPSVDVHAFPGGDPETWVAEQVAEIAATVFDLHEGPLARVRHLRLGAGRPSVLVFNIHHTVFDGLSWKTYLRQLEAAYTALFDGREPEVRPERQAEEAYERWSRRVGSPRYWVDKLADAPAAPPIGLPGEEPRRNATHHLALDEQVSARVREFCAAEGVTTSMFFVALCFVLLHRQTRQDDLLLGVPISVRDSGDAEVIGHLTNTVVLRHRLAVDGTARDVLRAVKRDLLDALRHRHTPLESVVSELRAAGSGELFNAMITVMPWEARNLGLRDWGVETWEHPPGGAKYDLAIVVDERPDRYTLIVEHTGGEAFTAFLAQRLETLVGSVLTDPDEKVRDLRWTSIEEERATSELCARRTAAPELGTELTTDLIQTTGGPAVVADGTSTDYASLAQRAEAVAAWLAARGIRDGQPVAVLMRPGLDLVTAVLGILRAGGAYVVLDPGQPVERLDFQLEDCGAQIVLRELPEASGPVEGPRKSPRDTAYIVYTSGSTGRPKGVELTEATLANLVHNQAGPPMRTLQYMPPAFDVFAIEVFGALGNGGTLVIPPASARTDFEELAALLRDERIERVFFPYVALRELAAVLRSSTVDLPDLREVYVTGERLVVTDDLREMFRRCPDARLINAYGPSEAHLCSADRLPADPGEWPALPSIGRVVDGVDAYVFSDTEAAQVAPFGVEGELCVAGPVVSPGYLGLPEKTRQSMIPDPFVPGHLMYRTGDVVVLAPDGRLHYRGRADDQVKIQGYRVEPGEVEAALERELGVDAAAVIAVTSGQDRVLRAFVQGEPPADWRSRLGAVLPGYLIPRDVTRVDTFPVNVNGKTDRRALEAIPATAPPEEPAEWTAQEREMAEVWAEVLEHPPASRDTDFFALGGNSLLAARLHRLVKQRFDTEVGLSALLSTPTVPGMTRSLVTTTAELDLRAEARLGELVVGERREPVNGVVLLTGATGFLGSHLLDELQRTGHRVRCLIRADSVAEARQRLRETFEKFAIDPSRLDEAEICLGDLAAERLGLDDFEARAREVTEVYHAAAHINFVVPYHTVKRTNVDGLRELLGFCGVNRTPLRLISTLGVFPPDDTTGLVEEDTVPGDPASLGIGYSQSKWVAEQLALAARRAGLPVTLHRVGRIGGHSRTGACRHDDFFWLQLKGFALLGCYPEEVTEAPAVDLLPVDYVARALITLSEAEPDDENWHLYHAEGLDWPTILDTIRDQGYPTAPTAQTRWMAELEHQVETRGEGLGPLVPMMREGVLRLGAITFGNEKTRRALAEAGCPPPPADPDWLRRMFEYFRAAGAVPPPAGTDPGGRHA